MNRCSLRATHRTSAFRLILLLISSSLALGFEPLPLRVSADGHALVLENGDPFFWLGDTAWSIFDQSVKEATADQPAIDLYFQTRKEQGFTVIQTHFLTNLVRGPIEQANAYGYEPFIEGDFTRPRTLPGADDDYWDYADYLVERAGHHGFYVAVVAAWSNSLRSDSHPFIARPEVAYGYGFFLGNRYREHSHLIWLLGGDTFGPQDDRGNLSEPRRAMTRALAEGIADGVNDRWSFDGRADYSTTLMSYHPPGGGVSSSQFFHDEEWLDFNMIQTTSRLRFTNFETVAADYAKAPAKPTLDCEVAYEYSIPLNGGDQKRFPGQRVSAWEVRRAGYWNVFSGGFGHTYGHRNLIGWVRAGEKPLKWGADGPWSESLDAPGARQMAWLRWLIESRPMLGRVPDQSLLSEEQEPDENHASATRDGERRYAFVYLPAGKAVTVRLEALSGEKLIAWWYNPRDGSARRAGVYETTGAREFTPPSSGPAEDWVLVLDDATAGFPAPGTRPDEKPRSPDGAIPPPQPLR